MRALYLSLLFMTSCVAAPAYATDAGSCYAVSSSDARAYCLAKAHGDPSGCYSIQSADARSQCLAEVRR